MKKVPRANAKEDRFKLSAPLRKQDWQFFKLKDGEHQMAWKWESGRQIRGSGAAWLDFGDFRKKATESFLRRPVGPAYEVTGKVDSLPRCVPGTLLLTIDVDCSYAAKDIATWVEKRILADPHFQATPKTKSGRRNDFETWLFQLAMVRLYHAGTRPEKIIAIAKKHWSKRWNKRSAPAPEEIHGWRADTMDRLSKVKF